MKRTGKRGLGRWTESKGAAAATPEAADGSGSSANAGADSGEAGVIGFSDFSLHDLLEQQVRAMLDSVEFDQEQRQGLLAAMACPCRRGGVMSYSVKLRSGSKP